LLGVVGARFFKFLFLLDRFTFLALLARLVFFEVVVERFDRLVVLATVRLDRLATLPLFTRVRLLFLVRLVPAGERFLRAFLLDLVLRFLAMVVLALVLRFLATVLEDRRFLAGDATLELRFLAMLAPAALGAETLRFFESVPPTFELRFFTTFEEEGERLFLELSLL
jgi:hypothetical protein